ncbi:MAG: 4Fe-4S binding protein [Nitrospiraceae bacterium]|nr:4Fe-4S binding protein [Nitrospiraceae bacterium]
MTLKTKGARGPAKAARLLPGQNPAGAPSPKGRISIRRDICKGCKYCVLACPKGVIELDEKPDAAGFLAARAVRMEKCTGCALCARMCPEVAIEVWAAR